MTIVRSVAHGLLACVLAAGVCGCGGRPKIKTLAAGAVIVAFGDSLTSGSGASEAESYPAVLAALTGCKVINAGVPGELSVEGLGRLPAVLREHKPDLVIVCHGGNDMLQRVSLPAVASHVQSMVEAAQAAGADVILLGVPTPGLFLKAPPFYKEIAERCGVPCDVKILPGILATGSLKSDAIHPNAAGYRKLALRVADLIRKSQ
jgi:lysophospholipase L1-like esterase